MIPTSVQLLKNLDQKKDRRLNDAEFDHRRSYDRLCGPWPNPVSRRKILALLPLSAAHRNWGRIKRRVKQGKAALLQFGYNFAICLAFFLAMRYNSYIAERFKEKRLRA